MVAILNIEQGTTEALGVLRKGGLVAVPTETVYGLAADATNAQAVARIYRAKGRPDFNPLICHVSDLTMAERHGIMDETSRRLAQHFWPGALTLVVKLREDSPICPAVTAGLDTVALRVPRGVMAELARGLERPIAAPSANSSGRISPTRASHVADDLGDRVDLIVDGGACLVGVESTIVRSMPDGVHLLREGGISAEQIEQVAGPLIRADTKKAPRIQAPGMMLAHYAPRTPIRLDVRDVEANEAYLAFGPVPQGISVPVRNLSAEENLDEAAHNLFAMLAELDKLGRSAIAVAPIPKHGLGAAINDRLKRAAHGVREAAGQADRERQTK